MVLQKAELLLLQFKVLEENKGDTIGGEVQQNLRGRERQGRSFKPRLWLIQVESG